MRRRVYECSSCSGRFDIWHVDAAEPPPRACPLCGEGAGHDESERAPQPAITEALSAPLVSRGAAKSMDDVYRAMEQGAEHRAMMAREQFGLDAAEASALKITNMRDNPREGENSVIAEHNDVTRAMAAMPNGLVGAVSGLDPAINSQYMPAVSQGPFPNAGAHTQAALRKVHARALAGSGHAGPVSSDAPALETMMPGYRSRVR